MGTRNVPDYDLRHALRQGTFALHQPFRMCSLPSGMENSVAVSRNLLVVLILVLVAGLAATGYALYQEKKQPEGVEISVGKNGLSIKEK